MTSPDAYTWHGIKRNTPIEDFAGRNLWARFTLAAPARESAPPIVWLNDLAIRGECVPPAADNESGVSLNGEKFLVMESTGGKEDPSGRYVGTVALHLSDDGRFDGATEFRVQFTIINLATKETNLSNNIRRLENRDSHLFPRPQA